MDELAITCEQIASHASRLKKISLVAEYLRTLNDDDIRLAVQFLSTGPVSSASANHTLFETEDKPKLSIGYSVLRAALQAATGWDTETLRACNEAVGNAGETISLLLRGISREHPLTLTCADELYQKLFRASSTEAKRDLLVEIFLTYRPLTIKYFIRIITRGGLRIGLTAKMVEEAVALASNAPYYAVSDPVLTHGLGTLHVAITSAEQAIGGRAVYTLGVKWDGGFVNVGKADSSLTDAEGKELTKILRRASTDRFARVMLVRPEVVLEVAFDGVQKSPRHKGGYALRFPRILRWRRDKKPEDCDDLTRVEALYQASLQ